MAGHRHLERVRIVSKIARQAAHDVLTVKTEILIRAAPSIVYHFTAGDPTLFWKWMTDRRNPGCLAIQSNWPSIGSVYRYQKRAASSTRIFAPWSPWDKGTVRVVANIPNRMIELEEHQDTARVVVRTSFYYEPLD